MIYTQFKWNDIYANFLEPIPFLCYCVHPYTAPLGMKADNLQELQHSQYLLPGSNGILILSSQTRASGWDQHYIW